MAVALVDSYGDLLSALQGDRRAHSLAVGQKSEGAAGHVPPARVVMDVLGHLQLAITTDLYSHVMPTALREAADAMDQVLGPAQ